MKALFLMPPRVRLAVVAIVLVGAIVGFVFLRNASEPIEPSADSSESSAVESAAASEASQPSGIGARGPNNQPPPTMTPVGTPTGAAVTQIVGAAGGTVTSGDGTLTVTIPPGALAADTNIEVQPVTNHAWGGRGSAYRLLPDGQTFTMPVTLRFKYTDADLEGSAPEAFRIAYQDSQNNWRALPNATLDMTAKTISQPVSHFSDWSYVAGWQLRPGSAMIQKGQQVALEVVQCLAQDVARPGETELVTLMNLCNSQDPDIPPLVGNWAVNGRRGGGSSVGTVSPSGVTNIYAAPGNISGTRTFAVSAEMLSQRGRYLLVSNITVTDASGWSGTVSWSLTGKSSTSDAKLTTTTTVTGSGRVTFQAAQGGILNYTSGNATWNWEEIEQYTNSYTVGECMRTDTQTQTKTLSGMSTDTKNLVGLLDDAGWRLTFQVPSGPATGVSTVVATQASTGRMPFCKPAASTNSKDPYSGGMPGDALAFSLTPGPNPNQLSGSTTVTVGDAPPHVYSVTWSLQR